MMSKQENIEVIYPNDNNEEEKAVLDSIVEQHAAEIIKSEPSQTKVLQRRMEDEWMDHFGSVYRDSVTRAVIDRSQEGKIQVRFIVRFIYD